MLQSGVSIVRELHVYGSVVPVSARDPTKFQHQGFGTLLMEEAERIARDEHGANKISVISGVGTRNYYRYGHNFHNFSMFTLAQNIFNLLVIEWHSISRSITISLLHSMLRQKLFGIAFFSIFSIWTIRHIQNHKDQFFLGEC